jgi:hypothetical protein
MVDDTFCSGWWLVVGGGWWLLMVNLNGDHGYLDFVVLSWE